MVIFFSNFLNFFWLGGLFVAMRDLVHNVKTVKTIFHFR